MAWITGLAAACFLCTGDGALAGPGRSGEIMRIERSRAAAKERIQLCVQPGVNSERLLCVGAPPPEVGSLVHLLDFQQGVGVFDQARITSTRPSTQDRCRSDQVSEASYQLLGRGGGKRASMMVGILGTEVDPDRGKLVFDPRTELPDGAREGEKAWLSIDRDGRGGVDLMVTVRDCTVPPRTGRAGGEGQCLSYWVAEGASGWRLANEDSIYNCR